MTESKLTQEENGDAYLALMSTQWEWDSWLIEYVASFHMKPHRNWFCEYEELGGDVLGDDLLTKTIGQGNIWLILTKRRRGTLPSVLHIPSLAQNIISIIRMSDVGVQNVFQKDTCKMV